MECGFKQCQRDEMLTKENSIKVGKKIYHTRCKEDMDDMQQVCEIYNKYYNDKESWAIMKRSLNNWYIKHNPRYMLFCISKAVRERRAMANFLSFYYILNDLSYMERYKNMNTKHFTYDKVLMTEEEYEKLLILMGKNESKLSHYIRRLNDYMNTSGRTYDSHYAVIKSWYKKDEDKKPIEYKETIL